MRRSFATVTVGLLAGLGGVTFATVEGVAATGCAATITVFSGSSPNNLVLSPHNVGVHVGECVAFTNSSHSQVTITVSNGSSTIYTVTVAKGATASGRGAFAPTSVGNDTVNATGKPVLPALPKPTGTATVTVSAAPTSQPTRSGAPKPSRHPSPRPGGRPGSRPSVAPKPHKKSKHHTPRPSATGIKLPPLPPLPSIGVTALPRASNPLVAPGPSSAPPVTTSSSPVAAVIAGPLEPTGDNRRGLPVAVGVLVVLGMVTGWGRVLLAAPDPVDNGPKGEHRL